MKNGDSAALLHWRRLIVDVSIAAAIIAIAFAVTDATADVLYRLLILGALIGIALLLEPAPGAPGDDDSSRLSRIPIEPDPARAEPQSMRALDPAIVEATSV